MKNGSYIDDSAAADSHAGLIIRMMLFVGAVAVGLALLIEYLIRHT